MLISVAQATMKLVEPGSLRCKAMITGEPTPKLTPKKVIGNRAKRPSRPTQERTLFQSRQATTVKVTTWAPSSTPMTNGYWNLLPQPPGDDQHRDRQAPAHVGEDGLHTSFRWFAMMV